MHHLGAATRISVSQWQILSEASPIVITTLPLLYQHYSDFL